jgi:radical SAM protein with 4Fe4S-binding SPASM domain
MFASLFRKPKHPFHLDWIQLEVSALCNASCLYCPRHTRGDRFREGLMEWSTFERIEPYLASADLVYLQGWGEPLLHPDLWRMVRRVRAAGAATGFTTNGTLLGADSRERLIEYGVNVVAVSLAGATRQTHERFRPDCSFEALDETMLALRDLKRSKCSGAPHVHLAFLLLCSNLEEVPGLIALAQRWGASAIVVSNLNLAESPELLGESVALRRDLWPRATEVLEQTKQLAADHGIELHYRLPQGSEASACPENVLNSCFVSHRGDVSPCVFTSPGAGDSLVFGNVCDQPLPEIWDSTEASEFRAAFRERLNSGGTGAAGLPAPCRNCSRLLEG